jgi:predicted acylesterase/phospholipase RssA
VPQPRTPFEQIALLLQGGGALGAYQAGVYEALAEADLHPNWVAGISIGAINSAIIAGNPPKRRVDALREFWRAVSTSPLGIPYLHVEYDDIQRQLVIARQRNNYERPGYGNPLGYAEESRNGPKGLFSNW